jgi:hypothetical protein
LLECAISPLKEVPIWGENFYVIAANCGKEMPRGNDLQGCWVDATAPREMISLERSTPSSVTPRPTESSSLASSVVSRSCTTPV